MRPTPLTTSQETAVIHDDTPGHVVGLAHARDSTRDGLFSSANDDLANFFARPVVTNTYTWTPSQGSPFTANFNPWSTFFGNKRVINRVNNYGLMRANLHVRFMINGNGFYYGRLMADYAPLHNNDDVTSYATLTVDNIVPASQRMHVFIDPSVSCPCELYLPFVYYKDAVCPVSAEWAELGKIYVRELTGLKHANASTQPLTITVMMWATEVELAIPTSVNSSALISQAGPGDEYGTSPVSTTATAVAEAATALTAVPPIAPFARATAMAATGFSRLAKAVGLSKPANISAPTPMVPLYISDLAPSDCGDMSSKLTVDTKQELSIDPRIIGAELPDELSIAHLAAKESYLGSFSWATTKVAGDILWNTYVTPMVTRYTSPNYYPPACCFASLPFDYWRGKMRYRFQVVCSGYHRGRLRIVWDPQYIAGLEANVQLTTICDITDTKDLVIEVDWGQPSHYLTRSGLTNSQSRYTTTAITVADSTQYNGVLGVYVLNDLSTPNSVANNDISVNVFVSCTDLEVAVPTSIPVSLTNPYSWVQQAGEDDINVAPSEAGCGDPEVVDATMGVDNTSAEDYLVYFGERVTSFRQLLKRYTHHSSYVLANNSATNHGLWTFYLPDFPNYYGYNAASLHTTTTGSYKFNYVSQTLMNYLAPAFVGMRGALRTKYVASSTGAGDVISMTVERGFSPLTVPTAATSLPITSQSNFARAARANKLIGGRGAVTTVSSKRPLIEVEFPYYKNVRFDEARVIDCSKAVSTNPSSTCHALELHLAPGTNSIALDRFVSVGEDFTFFWFQGCPALSVLSAPA